MEQQAWIEQPFAAGEETEGKYLTVFLNGQEYGIPVRNVVQIVGVQKIIPLPEFPHYAKGIMHLRGGVIPVIETRLRLGMLEEAYTDRTCIVIVTIQGRSVGLVVDGVDEVTDLDENEILSSPVAANTGARFISGVCKHKNKVILLMEVEQLLEAYDAATIFSLASE